MPYGLKASAISAGWEHSLALTPEGEVLAWGLNSSGECNVPKDLKAIAVSAGKGCSMALRADGSIVVWGGGRRMKTPVPNGTYGFEYASNALIKNAG